MSPSFSLEDFSIFDRYPSGVAWNEVEEGDKERFKRIRKQLKAISEDLVSRHDAEISLKAETSLPTPNGRSPREIWCCVYHVSVPNKSYGFQMALIISQRGVEICFCLGSGTCQVSDPSKRLKFEEALRSAKATARTMDRGIHDLLKRSLNNNWRYRKAWLSPVGESEFESFEEWLAYASSPEGNSASISKYYPPETVVALGSQVGMEFDRALEIFLPCFKQIYPSINAQKAGTENSLERESTLEGLVQSLNLSLQSTGLQFETNLIRRFLAALLSKRFVILSGLAGSGKTKLAQAIAKWMCPSIAREFRAYEENPPESNPCYALLPVGADWASNENILGYPNGLNEALYETKPALRLILQARDPRFSDVPHFLILDEMNLSHVERYFADMLSAMESGESLTLHHDQRRAANGDLVPGEVALPDNLFIIGTVNIDETTYMFSPKVLDRANVIEFRMEATTLEKYLNRLSMPSLMKVDGEGFSKGFATSFAKAANSSWSIPDDIKDMFNNEMLLWFSALQGNGAEFGFRTAYEAARFMYYYDLLAPQNERVAKRFSQTFDFVVVQKFLPKLHGSQPKLGPLLKKLWFLCVNTVDTRGVDALISANESSRSTDKRSEPSTDIPEDAPYPVSAEKIARMWRLLRDNGFTSFAEA